ncbi:hypothetical protein D3C77_639530 [compost metagenome]
MDHLQVGKGMRDMAVAIALPRSLKRIKSHPRGTVANAMYMDGETIGIECTGVVLEVLIAVIDDTVILGIFAVGADSDRASVLIEF